jgi:hypothetical protein
MAMVISIARLQLKQLLKSPRWLILLSIYCFVIAIFSNQFSFQFIKLQASNTSQLSLSGILFSPLDNLAVFLLLLMLPLIVLQLRPSRIASGLQRLLSSYPVSSFKLWLADWYAMLILLLFFYAALVLIQLPILISATIDLPLFLTHWLALVLMSLSFMTFFLLLQQLTNSLLSSLVIHYSVLFLFWIIQLLQQWPDYFYVFQVINLFDWFDRLSLGLLNAQDILAFVIINLSFIVLCYCFSQQKTRFILLTCGLTLLLLFTLRLFPLNYVDTTSNQRYSLHPVLAEQLAQTETIKITSYGLDEAARREVNLRLLQPVLSRFAETKVTHKPLNRQSEQQRNSQSNRGVLFTIGNIPNDKSGQRLNTAVNQQTIWLDYPFVEHPQRYLLRSLAVLQHRNDNWVLFVEGQDEASISQQGQRHLSTLNQALQSRGFQLSQLSLKQAGSIPDNTALLVIASSRQDWLDSANQSLMTYLQTGGNLLWLRDPEDISFEQLESYLGITKLDGVIVDPAGYQQGTPHPAIVLHDTFTDHPINQSLKTLVAFPWSSALVPLTKGTTKWHQQTLLTSHPNSWTEFQPEQENMAFNEQQGELQGEFQTLIALQRNQGVRQQKVVIAGDSHFLSDMAINNYDNKQLALNIFYWLTQTPDELMPTLVEPVDRYLKLTPLAHHLISWFIPFVLPLLLLLSGVILWRKQKR